MYITYTYYHCTKSKNPKCSQGSVRVEDIEKQIDEILSKIQISDRFKNWAIKYLNEINNSENDDRTAILVSLRESYDNCVARLNNLLSMKISPQNSDGSLLSDEEYKTQNDILLKEKESIEEKMGDSGDRIIKWLDTAEKTFDFAVHAKYWFEQGDLERKRNIFQSLGQNLILKDKIVRVDLGKPLQFIEQAKNESDEELYMLEPEEKIDIPTNLEVIWTKNPIMLPREDSNLGP